MGQDNEKNVPEGSEQLSVHASKNTWKEYPFELPRQKPMELKAAGLLKITISMDFAHVLVKGPSFTKAAERRVHKFWELCGYACCLLPFLIIIITGNGHGVPIMILSPFILIINQKIAVRRVLRLAAEDDKFYQLLADIEGYRFTTCLSFNEVNGELDWPEAAP